MRRSISLFVAILALALSVAPVAADSVYRTERLALVAAADVVGTGSVVNIHPNGPKVYAHEIYTLKGALSETTYVVNLWVYPSDPPTDTSDGCTTADGFIFKSTELHTDADGNGQSDRFIYFSEVETAPLRGGTHGVKWEVTRDGVVEYETRCTSVTLD